LTVHRHCNRSCTLGDRCTAYKCWWRRTYQTRTGTISAPEMSEAQSRPFSACGTVLCFYRRAGTTARRFGAMSASLWPWSQGSFQNRKALPSPILNSTEALKKAVVCLSSSPGRVTHGRLMYARRSQSHLALKAMPKSLRSNTPDRPGAVGVERAIPSH
jgi:hypothetical protein